MARAKTAFTPEDVYARGKRTLEQCILHGTTHMRTQLEVDPGIGLRGLQGIQPADRRVQVGHRHRESASSPRKDC